ncbi:hypothetical protein ACZ90_22500 [Streptomyces albus subsp. albus]|nr:hypothetical protein ACZ90_22500 [Streptomyces albus subsp. albus]
MSDFPTGVAVVTTLDDEGRPRGMTCSALCSLSVVPPTLLICLRAESPTLDALVRRGAFTVNLLHGGAQDVGELFSSGIASRFDQVPWSAGAAGPRLTEHSHARADCRVSRTADGGSHVIVFGEVFAVSRDEARPPLLYGRRRYRTWPM